MSRRCRFGSLQSVHAIDANTCITWAHLHLLEYIYRFSVRAMRRIISLLRDTINGQRDISLTALGLAPKNLSKDLDMVCISMGKSPVYPTGTVGVKLELMVLFHQMI